jgi:hypothetical protein
MKARSLSLVLLVSGALGAQTSTRNGDTVPIPDTFVAALQKIVASAASEFREVKGEPIVGWAPSTNHIQDQDYDSGKQHSHEFVWRVLVLLPGARRYQSPAECYIRQTEITRADSDYYDLLPLNYACTLPFDPAELLSAVHAAVGPGWKQKSEELKPGEVFVSFEPRDSTNRTDLVRVSVFCGQYCVLGVTSPPRSETPSGVELNQDEDIARNIARIQSSDHLPLPPVQPGVGTGPVVIVNDTSTSLTLYISGATKVRRIIPSHGRVSISLLPGEYTVAGELADKSVQPFLGARRYSGGETETFLVTTQ